MEIYIKGQKRVEKEKIFHGFVRKCFFSHILYINL